MPAVYSIQTIADVVGGRLIAFHTQDPVQHLLFDSRRVQLPSTSLFFALRTAHGDGHRFVRDAYKKGIRQFILSEEKHAEGLPGANVVLVGDTLAALQSLAAFHRDHFHFPVIGITGSNGKTVVKEWLYQLLQESYKIIRSPKSFNSQVGVPLSVWDMKEEHELGIFEAGISTRGEMARLERIIRPTIGLLTNIGEAHDAGFTSREEKIKEKALLFPHAEVVIGGQEWLSLFPVQGKTFTWSRKGHGDLNLVSVQKDNGKTTLKAVCQGRASEIVIPFTDEASIENALNCWAVLLYLQLDEKTIRDRFASLHAVDMRLQLKHGINDCIIVNDSYSADTTSLKIALDFMRQQSSGLRRTVVLSDFFETGRSTRELYAEIAHLLQTYQVERVITVGAEIGPAMTGVAGLQLQSYPSTDELLLDVKTSSFHNEIILIKGARKYAFERVALLLEQKVHQTVLEINLNALVHNLKAYQKRLDPTTRVMAMVKAFAYGSGGAEIASVLQYHNVNYLGVAYADEGVELVKAGITLPVMVMNAEDSSFPAIVDYNLQPVIYSFELLHRFEQYLREQGITSYPAHIEIETGMNRLGFAPEEVEAVSRHLAEHSLLTVQSVFSHLAASEDPGEDAFTLQQARIFRKAVEIIRGHLSYPFLQHLSNTAAIVHHPELQMDMVRLGIGLYGIETDQEGVLDLQPVASLRSTIAQVKHLKKGESVSYNRRGVVQRDSLIATVRIGYADGYSRQFSNGVGRIWVRGGLAPVIGTVCMDMTMIDVTDLPEVKEGDEVIVFGNPLPVQEVASWIHTIPYELMTTVSQRVKRVYFHE
ncbi:MAG: bifunctional UDP-N-acetylmuramoyl-tripeptide:D-alanyl-D-alanine ligase/alanine racemase [Flavisolibacter sp.]